MTRRQRMMATWYAAVMVFLSLSVAVGINLWYTQRVASVNERKWCKIVSTMDDAYRQPRPSGAPPATPTAKQLAADMHQLRHDLHCGGTK